MTEKEIWKDIPSLIGVYQVSNTGVVRSIDRVITRSDGFTFIRKGQIIKQRKDEYGYMNVNLRYNRVKVYCKVHRLVGEAFIPNPHSKRCINHKNLNKEDNNVLNLEWVTDTENIRHAFDNGAIKRTSGDENPSARPIVEINKDGEAIRFFGSLISAAREYGLHDSKISCCCRGRRKSTGGKKWMYADEYHSLQG